MSSGLARNIEKFKLNFRYAYIPGKPVLTLRLAMTFLKIFLFKARPLRYVDLAVDYACNLKCEHCFKVSLEEEKGTDKMRLTVPDYERIAKEAMALGAVNFSFQGGEFVLYKDWEKVVKACQPKKNVISITTNGTCLTDENLDKMKRAGVDILTISLDSGIAEEHDHFRGVKGTFDKAMAGMDLALKKGFRVTVGSTLSHANLHSEGTKLLIDTALKNKTILSFILAVPAGKWQDNEDILLTDEDMAFINNPHRVKPLYQNRLRGELRSLGLRGVKRDTLSYAFWRCSLLPLYAYQLRKRP